jgi:hypothetical protein
MVVLLEIVLERYVGKSDSVFYKTVRLAGQIILKGDLIWGGFLYDTNR